ncbi:MAG: OmpH family outer membrane protein [Desulfovibrio sp.]|jgi:outer membrane protein|nr:OmpH family outer membrane protein [Desulfovibrio sp.]
MRKIFCLAAVFLLCAAPGAGAAELSIGVFDLQKVAAACDAVQDARAAIDSKYGAQKMLLEKDRAALEKKMEGFQTKKPTPKQQEDFTKEQREYTERAQAFMRLLQADELRVRQDIDSVINQAAENLAKRKGYSLVMDIASIPYYDSKLDVTEDLLAETNVVFKKIKDEMLKSGPPQGAATNATAPAPRNARPGGAAPQPGTGK